MPLPCGVTAPKATLPVEAHQVANAETRNTRGGLTFRRLIERDAQLGLVIVCECV